MATGSVQVSARDIGRYRLILEQAQGPLGPLWIATGPPEGLPELVTLRPVATEWLVARADVDALAVAARWAQQLEHPHILRAVDVVVDEQELATVTEYREGEVLRDLLAHAQARRQPAPPGVALRVALDLLDALAHLDALARELPEGGRLVHGGLTPDSVLVGAEGHTGLLDVATSVVAQRVLTLGRHPEVASYLPPEQVLRGQADERSVVFSVGVLMWEMLAAMGLFSAPDFDSVVERVTSDSIASLENARPPAGDSLPRPLADIVARALERDAVDRYPTSMAMAQAIRTAARDALGTRAQVAAWVESLSAQSLRSRRESLESTLGIGLGALPPRASRAQGRTAPSAPAAQVPAPTDLTGTAPELPAIRRHGPSGRKARSQARLATDAADEDEATLLDPVGAGAASLLDEEGSDPRHSASSEALLDESDQLPTTLYRGATSDPRERDRLPGPEVLGEPAPWTRQPFFSDQPPAPRLASAEATPRDVPLPSWPPKPVRVAPRIAQPSTPPAPAVAPVASSVAEPPAQAADPAAAAETAPTPEMGAAALVSPGSVVAAQPPQAPPPPAARIGRRRAAAVALLAGLALACAAALASWLRTGRGGGPSIQSLSEAPTASPARGSSRAVAPVTGAADAGSLTQDPADSNKVDATATQTPEAGAPATPEAAEQRASPPATRAPTPKPASRPSKKFLPTDI